MIAVSRLNEVLAADVVLALADDDADSVADAGVLEAALAAAETHVRGELSRAGYDAAFPMLPPLIEDLVITFAVQRLYERRREVVPGPWKDRVQRAQETLDQLIAQQRALPGLSRVRAVITGEQPPVFDSQTLKSF